MRLRVLAAAVLAAALSQTAAAQDARRGADLAQACQACHGENGRSPNEDVPSLAGQPADFITIQMILFRERLRHVELMNDVAADMPDQDIEDLAAYFASLPPGPPDDRGPRDAARFAAGQALMGPRHCGVCHLPNFTGQAQVPRIAGQREEFLARSMIEYRDGRRAGPDTQMNGAVVGLTNENIAAIAHYLAHLD